MPASAAFGLMTIDGARPRVAVIGANGALAMVTLLLLEQFGAAPVPVATTEAAHRLLGESAGVDLAVVDLAPWSLDAIAMARLTGELGTSRGIPIIGLADERRDLLALGQRSSFCAILRKPYSPRELFEAMRGALPATRARALS